LAIPIPPWSNCSDGCRRNQDDDHETEMIQ
jgi:hypothetical protein